MISSEFLVNPFALPKNLILRFPYFIFGTLGNVPENQLWVISLQSTSILPPIRVDKLTFFDFSGGSAVS